MANQIASKLRFTTARQVVDAFPVLTNEFKDENLASEPIAFATHLAANSKTAKALSFCAHLLSRHDAVRWLCQMLRHYPGSWNAEDEALLVMAEQWAAAPSEKLRAAALKAATDSGLKTAPAWAAAAAGWAGGSLSGNPEMPVPPPTHLTGQAAKTSLVLAIVTLPAQAQQAFAQQAVEQALAMLGHQAPSKTA